MGECRKDPVSAIVILELAPPPRSLVERVVAQLSRWAAVPCRLRAAPSPSPMPYVPGRSQADADRLLEHLESLTRDEGEILVGLTAVDVGNPIFTHFFGRTRHGGSAALVSTARLTPVFYGLPEDDALTARRAVLEILHELGHIVGLAHCPDSGCLMRFAPVVEQIDNRGRSFCSSCRKVVPSFLLHDRA